MDSIYFYQFKNPPVKLSKFLRVEADKFREILKILENTDKLVRIISFVLMPNHFHLLLKQIGDSGISKFLSNFQNSYTRYFNVKHERDGYLFLDQFKAIRIESDEQLLHVSRYIHLNPYTGFVIKSEKELETYPWSSYTEYFLDKPRIIEKDILLSFFDSKSSFKKFVFNQADYQKRLKEIQHLIFE